MKIKDLKVKSFVISPTEEINTLKGGAVTVDIACQYSFGGPNTYCDTNKPLCEAGQTTRCVSTPAYCDNTRPITCFGTRAQCP